MRRQLTRLVRRHESLVRSGVALVIPLPVHRVRDDIAFERRDAALELLSALSVDVGAVVFEMVSEAVAESRDDRGRRDACATRVIAGVSSLHAFTAKILRVRPLPAGRLLLREHEIPVVKKPDFPQILDGGDFLGIVAIRDEHDLAAMLGMRFHEGAYLVDELPRRRDRRPGAFVDPSIPGGALITATIQGHALLVLI